MSAITDADLHRAGALVLMIGNGFENYVSGSGYAAHELARLAPRLVTEIEQLRASEESWNKEAERHDRDHRAHYEERDRLRTMLVKALDGWDRAARALADDPHHEDEHRIAELRKDL